MTWPSQSPDLKPIEMVWDELYLQSDGVAANKCSAYVEAPSIPGDYFMKLVERLPRVCKAVIKAKGDYFEESQIYE